MKKVGYILSGYPEVRCIINRGGKDWTYQRIAQLNNFLIRCRRALPKIIRRALHKPDKTNWDNRAIYKPLFSPDVDVIHTFNTVCQTKTPWVGTFETIIPRTNTTCNRGLPHPNGITKRGFQLLRQDSCLALIALSEANKKIQLMAMDYLNILGKEQIEKKIVVCPPPQKILIGNEEFAHKFENLSERVEFIFVGRLFFRKGGAQVVDVLGELVKDYPNIHLTVVSSLHYGDAVSRSTMEDKEKYLKILTSSDWITYHSEMPNAEVLELCKKAHIGLLPTFADTYGYSVLEMQACGCPVITTDIRALPEMNNEQCGYLIHVPKHLSSEAKYDTAEELNGLKNATYEGLHSVCKHILDHLDEVKEKGQASLLRIKEQHSPEKYAEFLAGIYQRAKK